jgi:hypothetical protein
MESGKMKVLGYLLILLYLLPYGSVEAEEERYDYGRVWSNWTNFHRYVYLSGFKDGMDEGWNDLERFFHRTFQKDWPPYVAKYTEFYAHSLSKDFPDIEEVRDAMTNFYGDPSNTYLEFATIFLVSVVKIRGSSPEVIEKLLAIARKESYHLHIMRKKKGTSTEELMKYLQGPPFSPMAYQEIYGEYK